MWSCHSLWLFVPESVVFSSPSCFGLLVFLERAVLRARSETGGREERLCERQTAGAPFARVSWLERLIIQCCSVIKKGDYDYEPEMSGLKSKCFVFCRHASVQPPRVDSLPQVPRTLGNRVVPWRPAVRHGVRRHPVWARRGDSERTALFQEKNLSGYVVNGQIFRFLKRFVDEKFNLAAFFPPLHQCVSSSSNGASAWDLQIGPPWSRSLSISGCGRKKARKQKASTSRFTPSAQNRAKKAFDGCGDAEWMDSETFLPLFPVCWLSGLRFMLHKCFFFLVVFLAKGWVVTRRDCVSSNASDPLILLVALIELGHYFPFRLSF